MPANLKLTPQQEKVVLDSLNDACGDAWCEGEFNLEFISVKFQNKNGYENYVISLVAQNTYDKDSAKISVSCEIKNVQLIQDLVTTDIGHLGHIEAELSEDINSCLDEKLLPKISDLLRYK